MRVWSPCLPCRLVKAGEEESAALALQAIESKLPYMHRSATLSSICILETKYISICDLLSENLAHHCKITIFPIFAYFQAVIS